MADLFQSTYDEIKLRRSVQDGENLIDLLSVDGAITIVDDPTAEQVSAAQEELAGLHEQAAELAADPDADQEEKDALDAEISATERTASFPVAAPEETDKQIEETPEPEAKTSKKNGEEKKA